MNNICLVIMLATTITACSQTSMNSLEMSISLKTLSCNDNEVIITFANKSDENIDLIWFDYFPYENFNDSIRFNFHIEIDSTTYIINSISGRLCSNQKEIIRILPNESWFFSVKVTELLDMIDFTNTNTISIYSIYFNKSEQIEIVSNRLQIN